MPRNRTGPQKVKEKDLIDLSQQFKELQSRHDTLLNEMAKLTTEFDPGCHEFKVYKDKYADKEREMVQLEKALNSRQQRLQEANRHTHGMSLKHFPVHWPKPPNDVLPCAGKHVIIYAMNTAPC